MPLQATSGAASYDAYGGGVAAIPNYIEDVFSTYLYTGTGAAQTITNGIDLSTKGGLVWVKSRNYDYSHYLTDTVRGANSQLRTNVTNGQDVDTQRVTSFLTTGFTLGTEVGVNNSAYNYASWTFREQPKFFDVVTYTGDGVSSRRISHSLASTPGCIIVKRTSTTGNWITWHRSFSNLTDDYLLLNNTGAVASQSEIWGTYAPTSTDFGVGASSNNTSGATYVAYLFASDAGGFGLTGTDNVISCGSFTTNASGEATVNLGYEPQWVMYKPVSLANSWNIIDTMRGYSVGGTYDPFLRANAADAEYTSVDLGYPTATGFYATVDGSATCIYIAIRRGPMKVPTDATKVFIPTIRTDSGSTSTISSGFPPDLVVDMSRSTFSYPTWEDRLRGNTKALYSNVTSAEGTFDYVQFNTGSGSSQYQILTQGGTVNFVDYAFRRAPGFFDEVCYAGTNTTGPSISHNLGAVPELMIVKNRTGASTYWWVYSASLGNTSRLFLNDTSAVGTGSSAWTSTSPTSSVFTVGTSAGQTNGNTSENFVAYLFATCAGVSKVGSYTGNGTTQTINCGFTAGARFVLIKRTDSTGDWYVWDSARGIVAGNDPYLLLNSTAAEVTSTDYIDTASTGFEISSTAPAAINANGGSFIFLAIA